MSNGSPEILNTDQGSQCTAQEQGKKLRMNGKTRAKDNIFIKRLWRSVTYEHVYLKPTANGLECYKGVKDYLV